MTENKNKTKKTLWYNERYRNGRRMVMEQSEVRHKVFFKTFEKVLVIKGRRYQSVYRIEKKKRK